MSHLGVRRRSDFERTPARGAPAAVVQLETRHRLAALVDDVCGFSLFVIRQAAVTRKLEVEYLKPVLVGVPYDVEARVERREGRKVFVRCEGRSPEGVLTFTGDALFVIVGIEHFAQGTQTSDGQPRVAL